MHNYCRHFRVLAAITALEKIDSESGSTIYLGLWDYWLRVVGLKDMTG